MAAPLAPSDAQAADEERRVLKARQFETEVDVSWDPIVPNYEFFVTDCDSSPGQLPDYQILFGGAPHRPSGAARLSLSDDRLTLSNIGASGEDGAQAGEVGDENGQLERGAQFRWKSSSTNDSATIV